MPIPSVGTSSALTSQNNQVYEIQIKNLEKQKEQLEEKINQLRQQSGQTGSRQIQQEIPAYEVQLQSIEAQLEHLAQKQATLKTPVKKQPAMQEAAAANGKQAKKPPPAGSPVDMKG
ncbi:MAG TPA: hypothetical protein PKA10_08370 [Selenomonadales bacterium]|nr:hypothetical protein [Selenomonadales bacterium]